ncbi:MAG TPA: hypothetical protein VK212_03445 [Lentimicrobium sp.]|nr:hypothetical protein [Lentimicrobium sp.]
MRYIKLPLLLFCIVFASTSTHSQGENQKIMPTIVTPSANAASLGNFGKFYTNEYNGIPSVSIPLYEVKSGEIRVPITLNYNSKGIKVNQEASWVGLGWSLNAGGIITRKVNGIDDFKPFKGYIYSPVFPEPIAGTMLPDYSENYIDETSDLWNLIQDAYNGIHDSEPDLFYISFLGRSNELFFEKQNDEVLIATAVNQDNLLYKYNTRDKSWEIIDEYGWKYIFSTNETTTTLTSNHFYFDEYPDGLWSDEVVSSWYLDNIVTPEGDEVEFLYSDIAGYSESQPSYDEIISFGPFAYGSMSINGKDGLMITKEGIEYSKYYVTVNRTKDKYLDKIIFNNGYVKFETEDRFDILQGTALLKPQCLTNLKVFNKENDLKKVFNLNYTYFNQSMMSNPEKEKYLRLKLNSVKEGALNENGQIVFQPSYYFNYNNTPLPIKTSNSADLWGYYNGANSNIQLYEEIKNVPNVAYENLLGTKSIMRPRYVYFADGAVQKILINGMDRNPNQNFIMAGVLQEITYPTKGKTQFEYEMNDYSGPFEVFSTSLYNEVEENISANSLGNAEEVFSISENGAFVYLFFDMHCYIPNTPSIMAGMKSGIYKKNIDNSWSEWLMFNYSDIYNPPSSFESHVCIVLDEGSYKLVTNNGGCVQLDLSIDARILTHLAVDSKSGDGLRIKSIKNLDQNSQKIYDLTKYKYTDENGKSTGKLMNKMQYFYNETDLILVGKNIYHPSNMCCFNGSIGHGASNNYIVTWAQNVRPNSTSAEGSQIGYSLVTITKEDINGSPLEKVEKYFTNQIDNDFAIFFPSVPTERNLNNGKLIKEIHFENNNKIKKTECIYLNNPLYEKSIYGVKTMIPVSPLPYTTGERGATARYYQLKSQWWYLSKEVTELYSTISQTSILSKEKNYSYENSNFRYVTKITENLSNGSTQKTIMRYPPDISGPDNVYMIMTNKNIINFPIETISLINDQVISANLNTYKEVAGNYCIDKIYKLDLDHPIPFTNFYLYNTYPGSISAKYTPILEFTHYNDKGKPMSLKLNSGIVNSYKYDLDGSLICTALNACESEYKFTSFENSQLDGWVLYPNNNFDYTEAHTGESCLKITGINGPINKIEISSDITNHSGYSASVWVKGSNSAYLIGQINGHTITSVYNQGSRETWNLLKIEIPSSKFESGDEFQVSIIISDAVETRIDDFRIYPSDSQLNTYTYEPLIGMSSKSDENNRPIFYDFDQFGRIMLIKDQFKDILNKYEYNYKN